MSKEKDREQIVDLLPVNPFRIAKKEATRQGGFFFWQREKDSNDLLTVYVNFFRTKPCYFVPISSSLPLYFNL